MIIPHKKIKSIVLFLLLKTGVFSFIKVKLIMKSVIINCDQRT